MKNSVETKALAIGYGKAALARDIALGAAKGQVLALIGPNGAGKSTLIRAILGQREYEGKITFHEASGKEAKLRIGYVPQSPAFDRGDPVSVMDLFTCCIFKRPAFLRPTRAMREKVLACLANVHGEALIDKRIGTLSGGELQRVLLALALVFPALTAAAPVEAAAVSEDELDQLKAERDALVKQRQQQRTQHDTGGERRPQGRSLPAGQRQMDAARQ